MSGLSVSDVLDLTINQVKALMKGISLCSYNDLMMQASSIRIAVWADDKDWRKYSSTIPQPQVTASDLRASDDELKLWGINEQSADKRNARAR